MRFHIIMNALKMTFFLLVLLSRQNSSQITNSTNSAYALTESNPFRHFMTLHRYLNPVITFISQVGPAVVGSANNLTCAIWGNKTDLENVQLTLKVNGQNPLYKKRIKVESMFLEQRSKNHKVVKIVLQGVELQRNYHEKNVSCKSKVGSSQTTNMLMIYAFEQSTPVITGSRMVSVNDVQNFTCQVENVTADKPDKQVQLSMKLNGNENPTGVITKTDSKLLSATNSNPKRLMLKKEMSVSITTKHKPYFILNCEIKNSVLKKRGLYSKEVTSTAAKLRVFVSDPVNDLSFTFSLIGSLLGMLSFIILTVLLLYFRHNRIQSRRKKNAMSEDDTQS